MNRKLLPLLIAGLTAGVAHADNIPTVYGKVNVTLNKYDFDRVANPTTSYTALDNWKLESNASRLGVKGDYPLFGDTKAIYKLEYEIFPDADTQGDNGSDFKQRNTYAGLQGSWGTLFAGKNDTPLKAIAAETVQLFKDLPLADFKYFLVGENRENNIIQYATPKFSGFVFSAQIQPGEDNGSKGPSGTGSTSHTNHGMLDKYSLAVTYNWEKLYLALADDHNVQNTNTVRAVGQYAIGPVTLGALWQRADRNYSTVGGAVTPLFINLPSKLPGSGSANTGSFTTISEFTTAGATEAAGYKKQDGYVLSAAWNVAQDWTIKGQYGHSTAEFDSSVNLDDTKVKNYVLGVDYALSKAAKVFAYYAAIKTDGDSAKFDSTLDDKTYAVGWEFKF